MPRILVLAFLLLAPAALAAQAGAAAPQPEAPTLEPGDVLKVAVWREEDLSGEFAVDENGNVTLPLLGERRVTGVPVPRLREELVAAYRAQLRNPSITITPLRRVNVLGEVNRPGLYPVDLTVSLSELIGIAGGVSQNGDPGRVRVLRGGQVVHDRIPVEAGLTQTGIRSGDQVVVGRRSWIDRNSATLVASLISVLATTLSTLVIVNSTQ